MFIATVNKPVILNSKKICHLETLLTSNAKPAISGIRYSGQFHFAGWSIRKLRRPHVIIDAQLENLQKAYQVKLRSSDGLIIFSVIVPNLVNVLIEYKRINE